MRVLRQDRSRAECRNARALSGEGSLPFDVLDQGADALAVLLCRKVLPARDGREDEGLLGRVLEAVEEFSLAAGGVFPRTIRLGAWLFEYFLGFSPLRIVSVSGVAKSSKLFRLFY